jgi:hypothetical protein
MLFTLDFKVLMKKSLGNVEDIKWLYIPKIFNRAVRPIPKSILMFNNAVFARKSLAFCDSFNAFRSCCKVFESFVWE